VLSTVILKFALAFEGFLQAVERPGSVHTIMPTSNGVTVCGSQFPPAVSKHCQHQHSAIPKTVQQCAIPTIAAVMMSNVLLPQFNIMAAFVNSHNSLFFDVSPGLPIYNNHNVTKYTFLFSTVICY